MCKNIHIRTYKELRKGTNDNLMKKQDTHSFVFNTNFDVNQTFHNTM